jgi:2Fe-2S ferredoxin
MPSIEITTRAGTVVSADAPLGMKVMEIIRAAGVDELAAMCGGFCSCATCHVQVDPAFLDRLPPVGGDENDLLDGSLHRAENSRLSCQILMTEALDGMKLTVAPED